MKRRKKKFTEMRRTEGENRRPGYYYGNLLENKYYDDIKIKWHGAVHRAYAQFLFRALLERRFGVDQRFLSCTYTRR